ncbi:MAG TPA: amidohydrolase family protein [Pirellulales bacterium]|jgi:L-fuconolactonase|nr:amidohydrolase family protein [Pirellulales bacterium]
MMRIDSHQHFWKFSADEYGWMKPDWPIRRDYLPTDLRPELQACGLDGCVAVQARQTLEETRWLLELADHFGTVKGVVGWVELCSQSTQEQLAKFAGNPKLVGVRHVVQDEPDDAFMRRADFRRGIGKLRQFKLTYDILIFPRQLPAAIALVQEFPDQPFVLDHLAKPGIKDGTLSPWREQFFELAKSPNVMCKVSGMVTEAKWNAWKADDFQPYLDAAFEAFGPDRLMFGSDWPVALLAARYAGVYALVHDYVAKHHPAAEAKIFGLNATRFYRLSDT